MIYSENNFYDKNRIILQELFEYRKRKEARKRFREVVAYYEDTYDEYEDKDVNENHRYG